MYPLTAGSTTSEYSLSTHIATRIASAEVISSKFFTIFAMMVARKLGYCSKIDLTHTMTL